MKLNFKEMMVVHEAITNWKHTQESWNESRVEDEEGNVTWEFILEQTNDEFKEKYKAICEVIKKIENETY